MSTMARKVQSSLKHSCERKILVSGKQSGKKSLILLVECIMIYNVQGAERVDHKCIAKLIFLRPSQWANGRGVDQAGPGEGAETTGYQIINSNDNVCDTMSTGIPALSEAGEPTSN